MDPNVGKRQYLITYSQADLEKFPTRESFGQSLEVAFNAGSGKVNVTHWACSRESHQDGGWHYHCSLKLSGVKKWITVKRTFEQSHGVVLHFSNSHDHYISAYRYMCKSDKEAAHSPGHPNLTDVGSPRTKTCIAAYRRKRKSVQPTGETASTSTANSSKKPQRLTNIEVSDFIVKHGVHNTTELYAMAESRKSQGECDLAAFIFSRAEKNISELIEKSWAMQGAAKEMQRKSTSRMEMIDDAAQGTCANDCIWLVSALEVLQLNSLNPHTFAGYLKELLTKGRGKWRNLMIIGPTNCAKTFMLKPLNIIFRCFENPSNDKYAWVGADKADCILMQDFRYSKETIAWKDLLLLLEGETVKLPAPKNHFSSDIEIKSDTPVFATSKCRIKFRGPYNAEDDRETAMMDSRWRIVEFKHSFAEHEQKCIKPCPVCFAKLVQMAE